MKNKIKKATTGYAELLRSLKERIRAAQIRASLSVNREMLAVYWDIGRIIEQRQKSEGWGSAVIPRLSRDICNELPEVKGFSERNLKRMIRFYREYPHLLRKAPQAAVQLQDEKVPQPVAQIQANEKEAASEFREAVFGLPWGHNILLMEKVKDISIRFLYMRHTISNGWSRNVLCLMIESNAHKRQGKAVTNFDKLLPSPQSDLALQTLKDPYIFDFLTLDNPFREKELETGLIMHLEKFLLELGSGFAFVGRQHHLDIGEEDFYIDLLFYHLKLRCFVVIELKRGTFKPGYAGQMNFYLNVVDDKLKHETDNPTIGLILCQDKNTTVAEYALRGFSKPIGISEYELTRALPEELKSALPTIEEIEAELGREGK
jgi:predicted nuclease of restriction endonuclease-like (RecB) superfamily